MELHETVSKVIKEICKKYSISPNEIEFLDLTQTYAHVYNSIFFINTLQTVIYGFVYEKSKDELDIFLSDGKLTFKKK